MTDKKTSRRALFSVFRSEPRPAGFSLAKFYEERAQSGAAEAPMPPVPLRPGLPEVPTTDVGVPERSPLHDEEPPVPALPDDIA